MITTPSKTTSTKRLQHLLRVANEFKTEPLHLNMHCFTDGFNGADFKSVAEVLQTNDCGTTVCLAGRAGLDPAMRRAGLRTDFKTGAVDLAGIGPTAWSGAIDLGVFFGIDTQDAHDLFYGRNEFTPNGNVSKSKTLRRIIKQIEGILSARQAA